MAQTQSSRIIVLHLTKYGDSGLVVHAIDSAAGRCSYMLRGAGRSKHVTVGSFHNLAVLDIVSIANPKSSMALLKEYEPAMHLDSLRSDVVKSSIALFISELLYRTIVEQNSDDRLFAWLCHAIALLDATGRKDAPEGQPAGRTDPAASSLSEGPTPAGTPASAGTPAPAGSPTPAGNPAPATSVANFHLWFLAGLCTALGFGPSQNGDFDGSEYLQSAKLTANPAFGSKAAATDPSRGDNLTLLRQFTAVPFAEAMAIPLSGARRRDFCDSMVRYISYHLGINLRLRSLDVLHDLYS